MIQLSDEQAQTLLNYLGAQPYIEVAGLISMIAEAQQPEQNGTKVPKKAEA